MGRLDRCRIVGTAQVLAQGKPAAIVDKIVDGKLDKFFSEVCLLEQPSIRDDKVTIGDMIKQAASTTGENVMVRRFARFRLGQD